MNVKNECFFSRKLVASLLTCFPSKPLKFPKKGKERFQTTLMGPNVMSTARCLIFWNHVAQQAVLPSKLCLSLTRKALKRRLPLRISVQLMLSYAKSKMKLGCKKLQDMDKNYNSLCQQRGKRCSRERVHRMAEGNDCNLFQDHWVVFVDKLQLEKAEERESKKREILSRADPVRYKLLGEEGATDPRYEPFEVQVDAFEVLVDSFDLQIQVDGNGNNCGGVLKPQDASDLLHKLEEESESVMLEEESESD
eukprot:g17248.t1